MQRGAAMIHDAPIRAGRFSVWLHAIMQALEQGTPMHVPCGECAACCISSYFIHIGPEEHRALAAVPADILFPAPGLPQGHTVLGFDEHGQCPLFRAGECSIYAQRPRTCRLYDCRIFAATGIFPGDDKPLVTRQSRRWTFEFITAEDNDMFAAVRNAAGFLRDHKGLFPSGFIPRDATRRAVLAVFLYGLFYAIGNAGDSGHASQSPEETAAAMVEAARAFSRGDVR